MVAGKLCLQHEDLAKRSIPALVRELEVCSDMAVRNNVVITMCDLCKRYTAMVDKYIPNISACLKDSEPFIRRQTLLLLTDLLQVHRWSCPHRPAPGPGVPGQRRRWLCSRVTGASTALSDTTLPVF